MRIYRISLQNYRVFEDQLDLELPSGLIGVYGPNGAGKSYLIESIPWTLYGRTRTSVQDVRSSGSDKDCVTEIEFEHEDHLYRVNRRVTGRGLVKARVWIDNDLVSDGVKETNRVIHSVLGMDVEAFRASVFAEQKQLSAFSEASPADRQKLVLSLLGITPLDKARDMARADARAHLEQLKLARASMPEAPSYFLERDECKGELGSAKLQLEKSQEEVRYCILLAEREASEYSRLESLKIKSDRIVAVGREKRRLYDELSLQVTLVEQAGKRLQEIEVEIESSDFGDSELRVYEIERKLAEVKASVKKRSELKRVNEELGLVLSPSGCATVEDLDATRSKMRDQIAINAEKVSFLRTEFRDLELEVASIGAACESAERTLKTLLSLGSGSPCPTCGKELGHGFADHLAECRAILAEQTVLFNRGCSQLQEREQQLVSAELRQKELLRDVELLDRASIRASMLRAVLLENEPLENSDELNIMLADIVRELESAKSDQVRFLTLTAERRELERILKSSSRVFDSYGEVGHELEELKTELRCLAFDPDHFRQQKVKRETADREAKNAIERCEGERFRVLTLEGKLEKLEALIEQSLQARKAVEQLEARSEVVNRVAEYLNEFRRSTIAALGPRLAAASALLFSELTEREYDCLDVDTGTWQLRISDSGLSHDLTRFSGSERDLANLAFRIAISEQIGHSFGQQVGLLVLDEIFGPLDDQRKFVMLTALDSLKARFNQVIVVTHGMEIKEQMPGAIEVLKLGGRRATARVA
ncbi:MAG: SMC family ATPase [Acidimicrobiaceae bacterium]|nr:SMC family ATPase [Acidimicrobiaceae bacterium]